MPRYLAPIVPLLALAATLAGQCDGNLGDNIFEAGDFGSGTANVLTPDPRIAPGFIYQPNPPPNDGFYTITNSTASWSNLFPAWRRFGDNSNDPNGYMMVVNASYEPGLFYQQEVSGLCENTLYQFSADITNVLQRNTFQLPPNVSFLIDDEVFFTTGNIPEDEKWNTYGFTFTTAPGQTSVILALRNNAPGGIGNDIALDNISFRACGPEALIEPAEKATVCEDGPPLTLTARINGDQYPTPALQWQSSPDGGLTWVDQPAANASTYLHPPSAPGIYLYRYLLANSPANLASAKCRVLSAVTTVTVLPKTVSVIDTICDGLSFAVGDARYGVSGNYVDTLLSSRGCDSIVQLALTVVPDPGLAAEFTLTDPSCSYASDGSVLPAAISRGTGPYVFTLDGAMYPIGQPVDSLPGGPYRVRITDRYGCFVEELVTLTAPPPFTVDLGPDLDLILGETARLRPSSSQPVADYQWFPAELTENCDSLCADLSFVPINSLRAGLIAVSPDGCVATDSLRIAVRPERLVFIPSAFSPNGDGRNDRFTVFGSSPNVRNVRSLRIYDRWGGELFVASDLPVNAEEPGWDGTADGRLLSAGTYVYAAEVEFLDGAVEVYSGMLTLVR